MNDEPDKLLAREENVGTGGRTVLTMPNGDELRVFEWSDAEARDDAWRSAETLGRHVAKTIGANFVADRVPESAQPTSSDQSDRDAGDDEPAGEKKSGLLGSIWRV